MNSITERVRAYHNSGVGWDALKAWLATQTYPDPTRYHAPKGREDEDDLVSYTPGTWDEVRRCRNTGLLTNDEYLQVVRLADELHQQKHLHRFGIGGRVPPVNKYSDDQPRDSGGRWSSGGYAGSVPKGGFKATLPGLTFTFADQAEQYPKQGPKGVGYFKGELGDGKHVDCLLYRDKKDGPVIGILNHFPVDLPPYEKKGNITLMVDPSHQKQGIGSALLREAGARWNVNLAQQQYTRAGAALANSVARSKKADGGDVAKYSPDQPRAPNGQFGEGSGGSGGGSSGGLQLLKQWAAMTDPHMPEGMQSREGMVASLGKSVQVEQGEPGMQMKRCFNNSIDQMISHGYDYMEGYGFFRGIPIAHAWNRDPATGKNMDFTWRGSSKEEYIGVHIPRDVVIKVASSSKFSLGDGILGTINLFAPKTRDALMAKVRDAN